MGILIEHYTYWFFFALGLLALEMLTGTFYMLVLSLGLAVGGVVGVIGVGMFGQTVTAGIVSIVGAVFVHRSRLSNPPKLNTETQNLDIGQIVEVQEWREDGTAKVRYRGAVWDAKIASPEIPKNKTMYIQGVEGLRLILTDHKLKLEKG